jgi:mycothiol synthase
VPHGHALAEVVAARGYEPWRFSYTMEIELSEPPPAPVPDGIELRPYDGGEAELVRAALNEAFADDPLWGGLDAESFAEFYLGARGFDPSLWLLAWDGGSLAGCSLAYPLRGHDSGLGWIGTLAVLPPWRRRGIGRALLLSSFAALYDRGLRRVGLGVDSQNATGALRLYEGVGMRKVRQSDNWRRAL